jgi:hypothetical protein
VERLDAIEARANAAMPGPWIVDRGFVRRGPGGYAVAQAYTTLEDDGSLLLANARFMAASREDVPALLAEVRRLQQMNAGAAAAVARAHSASREEPGQRFACCCVWCEAHRAGYSVPERERETDPEQEDVAAGCDDCLPFGVCATCGHDADSPAALAHLRWLFSSTLERLEAGGPDSRGDTFFLGRVELRALGRVLSVDAPALAASPHPHVQHQSPGLLERHRDSFPCWRRDCPCCVAWGKEADAVRGQQPDSAAPHPKAPDERAPAPREG